MKKNNRMGFFKRLKIAIFNLEEYGNFIDEKLSVSIKYLLILLFLISLILSFVSTYTFSKEVKKGISYFQNEFPDFHFEDGSLVLNENVEAYDKEYDFYLNVDTNKNIDEKTIEQYNKKSTEYTSSLLVYHDKIIYFVDGNKTEYKFGDFDTIMDFTDVSKKDILEKYNSLGGTSAISTIYMIIIIIALFITNAIELSVDCLVVSIVGVIIARICGIILRSGVSITLAIYSLTLSIICSFIYSIVYNFTGFEIKYFNLMYLLIAYVYIIAAILIIKTDLIKQNQELIKIKETQKEVRKELEEQEKKEEKEEKNEEDKKEDDEESGEETVGDPKGSEI